LQYPGILPGNLENRIDIGRNQLDGGFFVSKDLLDSLAGVIAFT
jgi:hypothetical protein